MRFLVLFVFTIFAAVVSALPVPSDSYGGDYRQVMLDAVNSKRSENGLNPLTMSSCLNDMASENSVNLNKNQAFYWKLARSSQSFDKSSSSIACNENLGNIFKIETFAPAGGDALIYSLSTNGKLDSLLKESVNYIGFGDNGPHYQNHYWTILFSD
ncbi:hypothetical protein BDF19DRAFT_439307 [Syncephalis fuscata]|nr:hypothetical protein BDF19DRAFT_439307 [Syncephalis fuscata]